MELEISPVLQSFYDDFHRISFKLQQIAIETERNGISNYPVFVASSAPISLGISLYTADGSSMRWNFSVTLLEDLVKKGIVERNRLDQFKTTYKDPETHACVLLILPEEQALIFIPYQHVQ